MLVRKNKLFCCRAANRGLSLFYQCPSESPTTSQSGIQVQKNVLWLPSKRRLKKGIVWSECATCSAAKLTRVTLFTPAAHLQAHPHLLWCVQVSLRCVYVFIESAKESWLLSKLPINSTSPPPKEKKNLKTRSNTSIHTATFFSPYLRQIIRHLFFFFTFNSALPRQPPLPSLHSLNPLVSLSIPTPS